jgi:PqqD family protein of HPr-rel-A system
VIYRAPPPSALLIEPLDAFVAVFHRPSGITHLLVPPAPQILELLSGSGLSLHALFERIAADYDVADADADALAARLAELVAAGLVTAEPAGQ